MAQTAFAFTNDSADGTSWNYCDSPAYNESGFAMYIEKEGLSWSEQEAPSLHYIVKAQGGHYRIWVHTWQWEMTVHTIL